MIGQLFSQLGTMFSAMGSGSTRAGAGAPVNYYELAKQLARQEIGDFTPVPRQRDKCVADAVHLAQMWLDDASALPSGVTNPVALDAVQWLESRCRMRSNSATRSRGGSRRPGPTGCPKEVLRHSPAR